MKESRLSPLVSERSERNLDSVTCPKCGGQVGFWTEAIITICWFCGYHVFKNEVIIN